MHKYNAVGFLIIVAITSSAMERKQTKSVPPVNPVSAAQIAAPGVIRTPPYLYDDPNDQ